jgi:hypothetical protein
VPLFAAADLHVVGAPFRMEDTILEPRLQKLGVAGDEFDTNRLAGDAAHPRDELAEFTDIADVVVAVRADTVAALWDAADRGDFLRYFSAWQDTAFAGLGALGQLDFEHADLFVRGDLAQFFLGQRAVGIPHTVFRRSHLHDDVAATLKVAWREATFAGRHPHAGDLGPAR